MYQYYVKSIPITNVEDKDKEVTIKGNSINIKYGSMIKRSFRIDDEMLSNILDSGDAAIKVFRYIASNIKRYSSPQLLEGVDN